MTLAYGFAFVSEIIETAPKQIDLLNLVWQHE
jgi:hypothetical protein